jgi:hypothetical protein
VVTDRAAVPLDSCIEPITGTALAVAGDRPT